MCGGGGGGGDGDANAAAAIDTVDQTETAQAQSNANSAAAANAANASTTANDAANPDIAAATAAAANSIANSQAAIATVDATENPDSNSFGTVNGQPGGPDNGQTTAAVSSNAAQGSSGPQGDIGGPSQRELDDMALVIPLAEPEPEPEVGASPLGGATRRGRGKMVRDSDRLSVSAGKRGKSRLAV